LSYILRILGFLYDRFEKNKIKKKNKKEYGGIRKIPKIWGDLK